MTRTETTTARTYTIDHDALTVLVDDGRTVEDLNASGARCETLRDLAGFVRELAVQGAYDAGTRDALLAELAAVGTEDGRMWDYRTGDATYEVVGRGRTWACGATADAALEAARAEASRGDVLADGLISGEYLTRILEEGIISGEVVARRARTGRIFPL